MALVSRFHKKCRFAALKVSILAVTLAALFLPNIEPVKSVGNNIYTLFVNGTEIGKVNSADEADSLLNQARRKVAGNSSQVMLIEAEPELVGEEVLRGTTDDPEVMVAKIVEVYNHSIKSTMQHSYTVKIDEFMVNVGSAQEVVSLLDTAIHKYDTENKYSVTLDADHSREVPVLVPVITQNEEEEETETATVASDILGDDGIFNAFDEVVENAGQDTEEGFDSYEYGITDISFANNVEVVEAYLPTSQVSSLEEAVDSVIKDKEQKTIYEVVSGDTLSGIAAKTGITVDDIIALNDGITSANSIIRIGDEIVVTVPKPELSVEHEELVYYEGTYEADVIYQYNDSWYTTTEVTLQDPSSGYHKAVRKVTYLNGEVQDTETVYEEVIAEAIPKIVEKGTKIPPTYIKPVSGGVITDRYGPRTVTFKGMTAFHWGVDFAVPYGTAIYASCGGTVAFAGWDSSYGYVIYINHPDGRQTRYAHNSKLLVSKGDYVSQGQKIALAGMTGAANGYHCHFEMVINGKRVNPLLYISY